MTSWAEDILSFYDALKPPDTLPNGIKWLYPQQNKEVLHVASRFFYKYYQDRQTRTLILGINPGRFGAGVTGINFTAPKQLTEDCGIEHSYKQQTELSAEFIYQVIKDYGGPEKFYRHFFVGATSPLGFIKDGKNINYYDDKQLLETVEPFIVMNLEKLLTFNISREKCFCIGGEKNYHYLRALNEKKHWFGEIVPLPHPRFIMQYKRKEKSVYAQQYLERLRKI